MFLRQTRRLAILLLASVAAPAAGALAAPLPAPRMAALGDLAPFRIIAAETLDRAKKGDLATAQKRGTDLETA